MPQVFEKAIPPRTFSSENIEVMRAAYLSAMQRLDLVDGSPNARLALVEIIQQLAQVERFQDPDTLAALAVEWYRSREAI